MSVEPKVLALKATLAHTHIQDMRTELHKPRSIGLDLLLMF